jgi:hypothetical protein
MSLKKLNLNSMRVAKPLSKGALDLLEKISQQDLVVTNECCNFDEELNDERDEVIDIEVTSEFKTITDMATQTKEEIKDLGFEVSFIYFCLKIGKNDAEIMDRCSITKNRLNKAYDKLIEKGYIKHNGYTLLQAESGLNAPQNASSEVLVVDVETIEEKEITEYEKSVIDEFQTNSIEDEYQTIPALNISKSTDEILFDTYMDVHKSSLKREFNKGDVFNLDSRDREYDFEKENNFIVRI